MTQASQVFHPGSMIYLSTLSQLLISMNPAQSMKACTRDGQVEALMTDEQPRVKSALNNSTSRPRTCD
jgi:hypothetical protein